MGIYNKILLPKVIDWACRQKPNTRQREKIVPHASGKVLEIGIGSGLNLPFYDQEKVKHVTGIDPSKEIWNKNNVKLENLSFDFDFIQTSSENLPHEDNTFDSILITYTLCTIPEVNIAMDELRRVLKKNGKLLFCEHGKAPDQSILKWQNRLNPVWKKFGGGCNLNRDIPGLIDSNGFKIDKIESMYIPGWKPASFNYWGTATPI